MGMSSTQPQYGEYENQKLSEDNEQPGATAPPLELDIQPPSYDRAVNQNHTQQNSPQKINNNSVATSAPPQQSMMNNNTNNLGYVQQPNTRPAVCAQPNHLPAYQHSPQCHDQSHGYNRKQV